ncbi:chemotaxis response regulator protein-glutamate methylesterase [Brevundimonas sp. LM2]|uniref:protein-glutamate methylesterase/protein-glutamine glutaminase n=1 Tax=Brevundimonas sp. LM2 TaxID=1938605 RepID=UPI000983FC3F|nr:chemotaxis response regulator protein-glutamate methylesterase [Brevundimonas sp. LM2]AQR63106.1 chemotaxis response regulator protein-glutamate methylesterase [Brevundimonas sp. LM2]
MARIKVLVVDDSPTMRALIIRQLSRDAGIEVIGQAGDPLEARAAIKALNPDVVTLDVEMPNMNGLEFLERLMRLRPMPVIMVSTLTQKGAEATLHALELGAIDCVGKPIGGSNGEFEDLIEKVHIAASASVKSLGERRPAPALRSADDYAPGADVVALGASTGGVEALMTVLQSFPASCPPTVVTQHMPANFTTSFASRLDRICQASVEEATDGAPLCVGKIYLAPGGLTHLRVVRSGGRLVCKLGTDGPVSGHRPSVDALFSSIAEIQPRRSVGAILTGMGRDGAAGLLSMRRQGAATIGQDEATSVVYGMPRAAAEIGALDQQLPLQRIASAILRAAARQ